MVAAGKTSLNLFLPDAFGCCPYVEGWFLNTVHGSTVVWCFFVIAALGWIWLLGVCVREIFMSIVQFFVIIPNELCCINCRFITQQQKIWSELSQLFSYKCWGFHLHFLTFLSMWHLFINIFSGCRDHLTKVHLALKVMSRPLLCPNCSFPMFYCYCSIVITIMRNQHMKLRYLEIL